MQLQQENTHLKQLRDAQSAQIRTLEDALLAMREEIKVISTEPTESGKAAKAMAMRNRELSRALGRERKNTQQAQQMAEQYQQSLKALEAVVGMSVPDKKDEQGGESQRSGSSGGGGGGGGSEWREKYKRVNQKLLDAKTQVSALQADLLKTQRALQREVGDKVPLDQLLNESGKWKGRAEEIEILKEKLRASRRESGITSSRAGSVEGKIRSQHKQHIQALHTNNQRQHDDEMERAAAAVRDAEEANKKLEALKARNRTLENSQRELRENLKMLLAKSSNDDKLVDSLTAEVQTLRQSASSATMQVRNDNGQLQRLQSALEQQKREHDRESQELMEELRRARHNQRQAQNWKAKEYEMAELQHQLQALSVESEKKAELADLYKNHLLDAEARMESLTRQVAELQPKLEALHKRLENRTGDRPLSKEERQANSLHALRQKAAAATAEKELLQENMQQKLKVKEEEIAIVRGLVGLLSNHNSQSHNQYL